MALQSLLAMSRDDLQKVIAIRDPSAAGYVPSECLVHLIRRTRIDNSESQFDRLYREIMRRIDAVMPRVQGERMDKAENIHAAGARDRVRDAFNERLASDRNEPGPGLDYFEVMFADAIAALRASALRKTGREARRTEPIERNPETNEPSLAVERAVGSLDIEEMLLSDDPIYRSRVAAAIDALPDKQRRVIEMIRQGMQLDSSDDAVLSIRKVLDVAEKTVRNRRDAAIESIRKTLEIGSADD
ncbi:DNA-binding response regulator [Sphingomonas cavernae]|uniref:DNA-binding response regulator n=2 Tax=Sphingomonas cavernae TaxID=2320861 RepID=A0A418WJW9_9SPHN|nr:DNA-binding response regulator [Sphingomonas cavernae]